MKLRTKILAVAFALAMASPASAAIIGVSGQNSSSGVAPTILATPPNFVTDNNVTNLGMQGFDELQNVLLTADLVVDGGLIAKGTTVSSQMIFLNSPGTLTITHSSVEWLFDGVILGTMSDSFGQLEADSTLLLGLPGTTYGAPFNLRGIEPNNDSITIVGNVLVTSLVVVEPGDWIRVVTLSPVPIPAALPMFGTALGLLGFMSWRRKRKTTATA